MILPFFLRSVTREDIFDLIGYTLDGPVGVPRRDRATFRKYLRLKHFAEYFLANHGIESGLHLAEGVGSSLLNTPRPPLGPTSYDAFHADIFENEMAVEWFEW